MPTLDVKISSMYPPGQQGGIRAYASATIDGCFAVRGIKVVEGGRDGLFVSMPSRKTTDGYREVCFPVTAEFRNELHNAVLDAYQQVLAMAQAPPAVQEAAGGETPQESQQMAGM
ncbi:MAG: SpoVG family protein [Lachnospiraceae bacterium]|nr:SpoVG family protein [Lachnospiraceae bacterium]